MTTSFLFVLILTASVAAILFHDVASFQQNTKTSRSTNRVRGTYLHMTVLSYNGKKKDFKPGSSLKSAVESLGVKPKYSCKKGDCASCQLTVGGQRMRPCVAKVPPEPRLKSLQEKGLEIK
jgi:ferredoxin